MRFRIPDFPLGALLATTLCFVGLLFISPEAPSIWLWESLIAISFIVWSVGAGFLSSKIRKSEEDKIEPADKASPPSKHPDQSEVSADISALINAIKAEGLSNRKEERKEDNEGRLREQITIIFIGITMGAIILQVHEMVKAYEPIHDQAKAAVDQAKAAIEQARAAATQAEGLKDQAKLAQDAAVAAGRAWVGPNGATMTTAPVIQQDSKIMVAYQNTGREPAIDFVNTTDTFVISIDKKSLSDGNVRIINDMNACKKLQPIVGTQVVYPSVGFGGNQAVITVPKADIDKRVTDQNAYIVTTGCFAYVTFKAIHHSAYCFMYSKAVTVLPNLNFCPGGSYAD